LVAVLSTTAGGAQRRRVGQTSGPSEQQTLAQATGAGGAQFLSQVQALAQQLGIQQHGAAITAKDVGPAADAQIRESLSKIAQLITAGSYVAGFGFAIGAILKFKAHKDNPTQVPISGPIVMLFIAAALIFVPAVFASAGGTLYDPSTMPAPFDGTDLLQAITPVLQRAKAEGLTHQAARGPLLPANATAEIRSSLQARGLSGQTLDLGVELAALTAEGIVAGARA